MRVPAERERDGFFALSEALFAGRGAGEELLCAYEAECSDFVRLTGNRVRQAGSVEQRFLGLDLIEGERHAAGRLALTGVHEEDRARSVALLEELREIRSHLPPDPYLCHALERHDSDDIQSHDLPASEAALAELMRLGRGLDLVGIWASGSLARGFASSLTGQRNWHAGGSFNLDWSAHDGADVAAKRSYAGTGFSPEVVAQKLDAMREELGLLRAPALDLAPGRYRAYLRPSALREILSLLSWDGFGLRHHRTAQTPLLGMLRGEASLAPGVSLLENHAGGIAPGFDPRGFIKRPCIPLIAHGALAEALVSPRSAREYGVAVNDGSEQPESLEMAAGELPDEGVLAELGTGLYVGDLWYLNYSDRNRCRLTGMTRFACLWVEGGEPRAPVKPMRFDESLYEMLGAKLLGLTRGRELMIDTGTYERRSERSYLLPGALIEDLSLTL